MAFLATMSIMHSSPHPKSCKKTKNKLIIIWLNPKESIKKLKLSMWKIQKISLNSKLTNIKIKIIKLSSDIKFKSNLRKNNSKNQTIFHITMSKSQLNF